MGINYSITGFGIKSCSGRCAYCSSATTVNYNMGCKPDVDDLIKVDNKVFNEEYKADWAKVEETIKHNEQYLNEIKKPEDQRFAHVDIWGADSGTNLLMTKDIISHMKDIFERNGIHNFNFSTSTNGLPFLRDDLCEWYEQNGVKCQLSHDGLMQFIRTGDFDPMDAENTKLMFKKGICNAVNTVLNFYNHSVFDNLRYWNDRLKQIFPDVYDPKKTCSEDDDKNFRKLYIKLNHIYRGTSPVRALNKRGWFAGQEYFKLQNIPYGNMNFRNSDKGADMFGIEAMRHVLDDYIAEWYQLYYLMKNNPNDLGLMPFRSYLWEQCHRFKELPNSDVNMGACRAYQAYRHGLGDPRYWRKQTFVIDTMGGYSECNLLDSSTNVKAPGGRQADYCKGCRFENQSECLGCGCEEFPDTCSYLYSWNNFLSTIALFEGKIKHIPGVHV
jgi:hypothetical protein